MLSLERSTERKPGKLKSNDRLHIGGYRAAAHGGKIAQVALSIKRAASCTCTCMDYPGVAVWSLRTFRGSAEGGYHVRPRKPRTPEHASGPTSTSGPNQHLNVNGDGRR